MVAHHFVPLLPVHPIYLAGHAFVLVDVTPRYTRLVIGYVASTLQMLYYLFLTNKIQQLESKEEDNSSTMKATTSVPKTNE
jgi:hypothetical protein